MNSGYLELIIGPMYAGKSTELIKNYNKYTTLNKKIMIVNHILNKRYGINGISTHNQNKIDHTFIIEKLGDIPENIISDYDVILIDELQFFLDAKENIIKWIDKYSKIVIAVGLDGDFQRNSFGDILYLIPHSDKVTKINALCKKCGDGTEAIFSKRIIENNEKTLIGSGDTYEAVCRKHYLLSD